MRQQTFINKKNILYLVSTPIGNLTEFSPRAIEVLNSVSLIACEDTRTSKVLLDHFNIKTPTIAYHKFNEKESVNKIIEVLKSGKDIALISDAGYPLISDPGSVLVSEAIKNDINVTTISGPSAFLNALVSSGFDLKRFTFIGFLDSKSNKRKTELKDLKQNKETLIFYEAPHRIKETLNDMLEILGNREIVLARELTKKFEEYIRGTIKEVLDVVDSLKGEMVVIVKGNDKQQVTITKQQLLLEIKDLSLNNYSNKEIVNILKDKYDLKKNYIYDLVTDFIKMGK